MSIPANRWRSLLAGLAGVASLVACGSNGSPTRTTSTTSAPSMSTTSTSAAPLAPPADRCGPPNAPSAHVSTIRVDDGSTMTAVDVGHGKTVAVLLHETDGDGLCGFWPYAVHLAQRYGVKAALVDLCGYGNSDCRRGKFNDDQLAQVARAVRWARTLGGTRLVLVGASMGAALALAGAPSTHADAVVDLSGPADWVGEQAPALAARVAAPTLVVSSPGDTSTSFAGIRALFARVPARTKKFISGDGEHGWNLLGDYTTQPTTWNPLADTVARWITGQYG